MICVFHCHRAWIDRRAKLDQCLELQLFNRDCEQAETWMAAREMSMADDVDGDTGVETLIKKHEDFDRAIASQEEKIRDLQAVADRLGDAEHYDTGGIDQRLQQVSDCVLSLILHSFTSVLKPTKTRKDELQGNLRFKTTVMRDHLSYKTTLVGT